MKNRILKLSLVFLLVSAALFAQNRKDARKAKVITKYSISFLSKGEGYDVTARQEIGAFVKDYEIKKDVVLKYFEIPWGREGEFDMCFNLDNMSKKARRDFVKKTDKFIAKYPMVKGITNEPCRSNREEIKKDK